MENRISLPHFVRESVIFSDNEKLLLAEVSSIPSEIEVDEIKSMPEIQELLNAFIGDESTRDTYLQLQAQEYLTLGDVTMAWKILLL